MDDVRETSYSEMGLAFTEVSCKPGTSAAERLALRLLLARFYDERECQWKTGYDGALRYYLWTTLEERDKLHRLLEDSKIPAEILAGEQVFQEANLSAMTGRRTV